MLFYDLITILLIDIGHIYLFLLLLGTSKISVRFVVVMGILFSALLGISLSLTSFVELNVILLFVFLIALSMINRKQSLLHSIYFALMSIVLFTVIKNGFISIFYAMYMDSPFNYYVWTKSVIHVCTLLFIVIVFILSRNFIKAAGNYLIQSKLYIPSYAFILICTALLLIANYPTIGLLASLHDGYGEQLYMIVFLVAIVLLTITTISTYLSKERLIEKHEQSKQEQLMEYVEKLEFLHDELATFRHDYANLLLSLEESIRVGDIGQVKQIYEQTIAPTAVVLNHQQLELTKLSRIGLPEVKSIISVKVLAAQRKSLSIHLDIPEMISHIAMPNDQFIRIISVLLDNAIEEADQSHERLIQVALFEVDNAQYFIVKNSIDALSMSLEAIYDKNYSSKGENRGIGLFSVQRIVQKYPQVTLSTKVEQGLFTQELVIKNNKNHS